MNASLFVTAGLLFLSLSAPAGFNQPAATEAYVYEVPERLDDGWKVSSLEAEGMDTKRITHLTNQIVGGKYQGIHSMVIVKNGALVHEAYFDGRGRDDLRTIYSITKSVTSALIGIAIDKGFIEGVDETLVSLLPEYAGAIEDERVKGITLEQILTLTSGLEWDEKSYPYNNPRNSEYHQVRSDDWVKFVLEKPVRDEPGTRYVYNTGSVHLLSAVLKSRTGLYAGQFAETYLFKPLGITRYEWNADPMGYQCTGGTHGGLRMTARDVAKFGLLFLRDGKWNGKQVISSEWVAESTKKRVTAVYNTEFGYLWWMTGLTLKNTRVDIVYGAGYGGQSLTLVPEYDLLFVFTCWGRAQDANIFAPMLMILNATLPE